MKASGLDYLKTWRINHQILYEISLGNLQSYWAEQRNYPEIVCDGLSCLLSYGLLTETFIPKQHFSLTLRSAGALSFARVQAFTETLNTINVSGFAEFDPKISELSQDADLHCLTKDPTLYWRTEINNHTQSSWLDWQGKNFNDAVMRLLQSHKNARYALEFIAQSGFFKAYLLTKASFETLKEILAEDKTLKKQPKLPSELLCAIRQNPQNFSLELLNDTVIQWGCHCSRENVLNNLRRLTQDELRDLVDDEKKIVVQCSDCGETYFFDPAELTPFE